MREPRTLRDCAFRASDVALRVSMSAWMVSNTRADGAELLAEAARIPIRPATTTFPLEDANRALALLKRGGFAGAGVLLTGEGSRV